MLDVNKLKEGDRLIITAERVAVDRAYQLFRTGEVAEVQKLQHYYLDGSVLGVYLDFPTGVSKFYDLDKLTNLSESFILEKDMLDVNKLKVFDVLVLNDDSVSQSTGQIYAKGTEVEVTGISRMGEKLCVNGIKLRYPDGQIAQVDGVADILMLVAKRFHKKTAENINLKIGDVYSVLETLLIQHCGSRIAVDAVEIKITGLYENNVNYEILDVHGTKYTNSCALNKFIKEIAVKNVKLRNEEKQEVKRIDIYSDRETLQLGDVVVTQEFFCGFYTQKEGVYGKVVSVTGEQAVIHFEEDFSNELKQLKQVSCGLNQFISKGILKIVTHRNVPEDFVPYKEVQEVEYVKTGGFMGVIGKKYFIQGGTGYIEVICIEEDENPMCIDANTFGYIGDMQFNELYEKETVTKRIPIAPTAHVTLK